MRCWGCRAGRVGWIQAKRGGGQRGEMEEIDMDGTDTMSNGSSS